MVFMYCCLGMYGWYDIFKFILDYLQECLVVVCVEGVELGDEVLQVIFDKFQVFFVDLGMFILVDCEVGCLFEWDICNGVIVCCGWVCGILILIGDVLVLFFVVVSDGFG